MFKPPDSTHECDNCGAKLPPPDERGARTCKFCGSVYTPTIAQAPPMMGQPINVIVQGPAPGSMGDFQTINPQVKKNSGLGCFIVLLTLTLIGAGIGIPIYIAVKNGSINVDLGNLGSLTGSQSFTATGSYVALPGEPGGPMAIVAVTQRYDSGAGKTVYEVSRFDGTNTKPVWTSKPLDGQTPDVPIATDGTSIFVIEKTKVLALKSADGSVTWQGSVTDEFSSSLIDRVLGGPCTGCFTVIGGQLIVKTKDGVVQAFDTTTGAPSWSRRLQDVNADVARVGERLVIVDGQSADYTVFAIDPATGAETAQAKPLCERPDNPDFNDELGTSSLLRETPDGSGVLFFYGLFQKCIQRWDVASGQLAWSTYAPNDDNFSASSFSAIDNGTSLVYSTGKNMTVVDLATGAATSLPAVEDGSAHPISANSSMVVALVSTDRGTKKTLLRAVDLVTGETKWDFPLGTAESVDPPHASPSSSVTSGNIRFTATLDGDNIRIVSFSGDTKKVTIQTVDATNGAATPAVTPDWKTDDLIPSFGPGVWSGSRVLTRVGDNLLVIDTATGAIAYNLG